MYPECASRFFCVCHALGGKGLRGRVHHAEPERGARGRQRPVARRGAGGHAGHDHPRLLGAGLPARLGREKSGGSARSAEVMGGGSAFWGENFGGFP